MGESLNITGDKQPSELSGTSTRNQSVKPTGDGNNISVPESVDDGTAVNKRSAGIGSTIKNIFSKAAGRVADSVVSSIAKKSPKTAKAITSVRSKISDLSKDHPRVATTVSVVAGIALVAATVVACVKTPLGPAIALAALPACIKLVGQAGKHIKNAIFDISDSIASDVKEITPGDGAEEKIDNLKKVVNDKASKVVDGIVNGMIAILGEKNESATAASN
ncbi:MAG: hypothetical protein LBR91_00790 [Puniceicoccales bacterium]|jgi:hypothetical protein|nr:hypothetical protein [Puniceicoccales bacterium]